MKRITSVLAMAALLTAPLAYGAAVVVTVDDNPANDSAYVNGVGGNFSGASAVKDALAAIATDAGEASYTVNIVDTDGVADTYTGDVDINTTNTVVQQVANGNGNDTAVTLQGDGTGNTAISISAANCKLIGLSATKQMILMTNGTAAQPFVTGTAGSAIDAVWQNLTTKSAGNEALDHNDWLALTPATAQVFDHCTFHTGNGPQTSINTTYNDCQFAGGGFKLVHLNGSMVVNRGLFDPPSAGGLHNGGTVTGGKTAVYNDCTFNLGAPRLLNDIIGDGDTITFNRPVFTGSCGDVVIENTHNCTININGTPTHKVDFNPLKACALIARMTAGTINFTDCQMTQKPTNTTFGDWNGALKSNVAWNFNRCIFGNGAGDLVASDANASTYSLKVNATNTIWYGTTTAGQMITTGGAHTGASEIDLTHCTMACNTGNAFVFGNAGDKLYLEGSIIYTNQITDSHLLSSIGYAARTPHIPCITYAFVTDDGKGHMFVGNPFTASMQPSFPGDLVVSPNFSINNDGGVIPANSPACGAATGSTATEDVNGNVRPQPANTAPDIGAVEVLNVPVELSSFQVD